MRAVKPITFEAYLHYDDGTDNRYELIDGELIALPPESRFNVAIANALFLMLVNAEVPLKLIYPHTCEIQVPVIQRGDAQNRYPDLVVLREEHLELTQKRLAITLEMPPPVLVVEIVSPGQQNRERDFHRKREQYCQRGIPEYWLIDPENQCILVLQLESEQYVELGIFRGADCIGSPTFPDLPLTIEQLFEAVR
jgi:Uma2 family endonuclease